MKSNSGTLAQPIGELDRRQRLLPQLLAPLGLRRGWRPAPTMPPRTRADRARRDARARARDRRRATTAPFFHQLDRRRRDRLILVVQQLRERVLDVARARPVHHVAFADALLGRHVVDQQHHPLARRRLRAGCRDTRWRAIAAAHRRSFKRVPHRGDVVGRVNQAEQLNVRLRARGCFSISVRASRLRLSSPPATNRLWCSVSALNARAASVLT